MRSRARLVGLAVALWSGSGPGCNAPVPPEVAHDAAHDAAQDATDEPAFRVGGDVTGLWTGGSVTVRLSAAGVVEDVVAAAGEPFTFAARVRTGATYEVSVIDDGADHDCVVANGGGVVEAADVTNVHVECTNLVPHEVALSVPAGFTFDPRVDRYTIPVSVLQQEVAVTVTGATLTGAAVDDVAVTLGEPWLVPLGPAPAVVAVVVTKGNLSQRYELVFDRGATPITEALRARAPNAGLGDFYGRAVAASGDYVAVGAFFEDSSSVTGADDTVANSGAVYIYRRSTTGWTFVQMLKGSAITPGRLFGASLDMDGDVLAVGAYGDAAGGQEAGAAYVFRLDRATGLWNEEQRITASDPHAADWFGSRVAISGDRLLVGASGHDVGQANNPRYGLVYELVRSGSTWSEAARIRQPSPAVGDQLPLLLALDGASVAALTSRGIVAMRRDGTSWTAEAFPVGVGGSSLALEGDTLVLGQPFDASGNGQPNDQSAFNSGAVRVYSRSAGAWTETAYLKESMPQSGAQVGAGVGFAGDTIVTTTKTRGGLLTFQRVGGSWINRGLTLASGPHLDLITFGDAIALSRNGAVVGHETDSGGPGMPSTSGTAWFFR